MNTMKRNFRRILALCIALLLAGTLSAETFAHEIHYTQFGGNPAPISLKWHNIVNGQAYLHVNSHLPPGSFYTYNYWYYAIASWNSATYKVDFVPVANGGDLSLFEASPSLWDSIYPQGGGLYAFGLAEIFAFNGQHIGTWMDALNAGGKITSSNILLTPYTYQYNNFGINVQGVICHEVGHSLGLGHSDGDYYPTGLPSVMQRSSYGLTVPKQHDIDDMLIKYS
jgi:hypothetical protein